MNKIADKSEFAKAISTFPWWRGAVIYQIYPRSFKDSNNDGIGDLKGIIERLDYVATLGVDGIWISPFFTSPMKDFGYDVSDYCGIDPMFGTMEDFDALMKRAHELGLKVIIDQVYSHTSEEHDWFKESRQDKTNPKSDWYVWADPKPDGAPPNNWQSVFHGSCWEWDARRNQYYFHNFLPEQPDLNMHNPDVQDAILKVAKFWLDKGVDGFRLDALNFAMHDKELRDNPVNPRPGPRTRPFDYQDHVYNMSHADIPAFLEKLSALINSYPDRFTVAEVGGELALKEMKEFTEGDKRLNTAYGFKFLYAEELSKELVENAILEWETKGYNEWPSFAFSNHDAPRAVTRWSKGRDVAITARFCNALLLSLRGNLFIYQGEELGHEQAYVPYERLVDPEAIKNWPKTLGRDGARTPIAWDDSQFGGFSNIEPWLPVSKAHTENSISAQESKPDSILNFTRQMISVRKANPALLWGDIELVNANENLLIMRRNFEDSIVFAIFNFGSNMIDVSHYVANNKILIASEFKDNSIGELGFVIAKLK